MSQRVKPFMRRSGYIQTVFKAHVYKEEALSGLTNDKIMYVDVLK